MYREENGQVVLTMSKEDFQRLILRFSCGEKFSNVGKTYICALPKNHAGDCDDHPYRAILSPDIGRDFLNRLNSGNPHYTPYQVEESKKEQP